MWNRLSLSSRINALLATLVVITLLGGIFSMWYSFRMEQMFAAIFERNLAGLQSAQALESALVNQKGFVSYYLMDSDPVWLRRLGEYRRIFSEGLARAFSLVENEEQKNALEQIERKYQNYITAKDQVIDRYKARERSAGVQLHRDVRNQFFEVLALCEAYKETHLNRIHAAQLSSRNQGRRLRFTAVTVIVCVTVLATLLFWVMLKHILNPIRRLSTKVNREGNPSLENANEIKALSQTVRGLIEDIDKTHSELEKSREHLLQTEKLALVGKLAAGMAHSIRNPFTSVKMRLFSLGRSLQLTDTQQDDLAVISEEIRHIDTIVQNFLEFSRPPKLKIQPISPSRVVDSAIQLLEHRLKSYDVTIRIVRNYPLPDIQADPEQLKEVMVNLIVNACEAMEKGGSIVICEEEGQDASLGHVAVIHVNDNGPGISEAIREKILQPFYTTKEEGTGLGLSIAVRIVEEHRGRLECSSHPGKGTTFTITLPLQG